MKEIPVFFHNKKREKLFGILSLPSSRKRKNPAVLMAHGFGSTHAKRKFVELARTLAKNQIASFRFDFSGCGDSFGDLRETTISKQVEELEKAYRVLLQKREIDGERIGILGHSLGGVIATLFQVKYQKAKCLVLIAPPFALNALIKESPKRDFGLGKQFFEEVQDYTKILSEIKVPILILHGGKDELVPLKMSQEAFLKIRHRETEFILIEEADHHFESFEAKRKLINFSVEFFKKYLL